MKRDLLIVAAFQAALSLAFLSKPAHVDEAVYLSMADHALENPAHPAAYEVFWSGKRRLASAGVPNPWLPAYLLSPAAAASDLRLGRLALVPVDLAAAVFLHLFAATFLARPLLFVLAVLAGPGWWLTVSALLAEKWIAALGFASLWAAARADPKKADRWFWGAAALSSLAVLTKYTGAIFPLAAAAGLWARGASRGRLAGWLAAALGPAGAYLASGLLEPERMRALVSRSIAAADTAPTHHARALLAFLPGSVPALALWAWAAARQKRRVGLAAAAGAALMLPALDLAPATPADRWLGVLLCASGGAVLAAAFERTDARGRAWQALAAVTLVLQAFVYWSVTVRFSVFAAAALALGLAAALERALSPPEARTWALAGLLVSVALGAAAALTDAQHAESERRAALELALPAVRAGRRAWFTGHWGLQRTMEAAGALSIEPEKGGWDAVRKGDLVVVPGINTNVLRPLKPLQARVSTIEVPAPLPFLLMCGERWSCQAGLHSSAYGFLPFSLTNEPLQRFEVVEPQ